MVHADLKISHWKDWLPVMSLAFAAFVFNTTEFVPIGVVTKIAESFHISDEYAALIITGYAFVVGLLSLPLAAWTAKMERRKLLVAVFCVFIVGHVLSALAVNFMMLALSRMVVACAHAVFWSITVPLAVRIGPPLQGPKSMSLIVMGTTLAMVLGIPLGTFIGQHIGWRITFGGIGVAALVVIVALMKLLPRLESNNAGSLSSMPMLLKRPAIVGTYVLTVIIVMGQFTGFALIEPFMKSYAHFSENSVVLVMLLGGSSGIVGSYIFTKCIGKHPMGLMCSALLLMICCMSTLQLAAAGVVYMVVVLVVWGMAMTIVAMSLQTRILAFAPDATDIAMSVYSGIFNIGIGSGPLVGGLVVWASGIQYIGYAAAGFELVALTLFIGVVRPFYVKALAGQQKMQPGAQVESSKEDHSHG